MKHYKGGAVGMLFYVLYAWVICFYLILIRMIIVPSIILFVLYGLSLLILFFLLWRGGTRGLNGKLDVIIILLFALYYFVSSVLYTSNEMMPSRSWIIKDMMYSLLPIMFYIIIRLTRRRINMQIILLITIVTIFVIDILSLIMFFMPGCFIYNLFDPDQLDRAGEVSFALSGVLGTLVTGFINIVGVILLILSPIRLNKYIVIALTLFFFICIFLTGQRTPIGGLIMVAISSIAKYKCKGLLTTGAILAVIFAFVFCVNIEYEGFSLNEAITERYIKRFESVKSGHDSTREDQQLIFANETEFGFLFGRGVGRYSPENPYTRYPMPDAMMYRLYNEMGLLGVSLFCLFFLINFVRAIKNKNIFMIMFVIYIFIANFFNRILFVAPISIIPYLLLAYYNWKFEKQLPKPSSSVKIHSL